MTDLFRLILDWANARNIVQGCGLKDQFPKLVSEFGELADHIDQLEDADTLQNPESEIEDLKEKITDDIGDCVVVLTILAAQNSAFIGALCGMDSVPTGCSYNSAFLRAAKCMGNLGDAIAKKQMLDVNVSIATMLDYLARIAVEYNLDFKHCIQAGPDDIKDRKGVMYNGTFIKESDPAYQAAVDDIIAGGL